MPKLIRLYVIHASIGFALAAVFVGMLLWFDIANLWHLVSTSDKGWIAVLALWISNGVVFGGVQFGIAVMRMKDDDDDDFPGGGRRIRVMRREYVTIPARVGEGRANRNWTRR